MANLVLTLSAADIKKAVKSDTYITGQVDKSADMIKNAALAYNEQAGDDAYHEVKLYRTMKGAVSKFEASMAEYVDPSSATSVVDTLTASTTTTFTITIPVGGRFLNAFASTLSNLAQEYIINMMLYSWWQSIKPALAKDYFQFSQESLEMVRKCLSKTAPDTSLSSYTDVGGEVMGQEGTVCVDFSTTTDDGETTLVFRSGQYDYDALSNHVVQLRPTNSSSYFYVAYALNGSTYFPTQSDDEGPAGWEWSVLTLAATIPANTVTIEPSSDMERYLISIGCNLPE